MIENHSVNIKNLNINYICEGTGEEKIILLHGWGANITLFNSMIEVISKKYTVYAMDMPGFGKSEEPKEPWTVDDYVDFVIEFAEHFGIKKTMLLGHSFGGRVIIKLVNRKNLPFEVGNLILVDIAGIKPKKTFKQKVKLRIYKISKGFLSIGFVQKLFPEALENLRKKNGSADYNSATPIMRQTLVKVVNEDLTDLIPNITQNTLLIWGKNDTATPIEDGRLMNKLIKNSGIVELEAGHYSFIDQMYTFNRVIASFLKIDL